MKGGRHDTNFFQLTQDVPRGGPHPRTSTTLPPQGLVEQLRFGVGFCPDVGGLFDENVSAPDPIHRWITDLKARYVFGMSLKRYTPLPFELQFKPTTFPDQPAPDLSNTVLRWHDDDQIWVVVEGFATDLLFQQPDGEHDLELEVAIGSEEEAVDWSVDNGDDVKDMDVSSSAQAPTDRQSWAILT